MNKSTIKDIQQTETYPSVKKQTKKKKENKTTNTKTILKTEQELENPQVVGNSISPTESKRKSKPENIFN